jgi:hypothetical protein
MRKSSFLTLLIVLLPLSAHAQNLYPKKDLAFAQVAAGGAYETIINVTNRGSNSYNGSLRFFHLAGQPWSPMVNGVQITNGQMSVSIPNGRTATYQITRDGGTEAGFAFFIASDLAQTSFLEGTLTYYVRDGGALVDSVGVQPSSEFYLTAVPFDDFSTIAYALANLNTTTVTPKLSVFSDTNVLVASTNLPSFAPGQHMAEYLRQRFQGIQMTKGRLEIQSDRTIVGTILTDNYDDLTQLSQLSSLPMLPAVKAYTFTGTLAGLTYSGEISLWFDGQFAQGFLRALTVGGVPEQNVDTITVTGSLIDGVLQVITTGSATSDNQILTYLLVNPYSLTQATQQGSATGWFLPSHILAGTGTLTLSAIN